MLKADKYVIILYFIINVLYIILFQFVLFSLLFNKLCSQLAAEFLFFFSKTKKCLLSQKWCFTWLLKPLHAYTVLYTFQKLLHILLHCNPLYNKDCRKYLQFLQIILKVVNFFFCSKTPSR